MRRLIVLFPLWLLPVTVSASGPAPVEKQHRVANRRDYAVCWWACAESIGNQYGIKELRGLTQKVVDNGVGRDTGARQEDIDWWMAKLGLKLAQTSGRSVAFLQVWLDRKVPVIVSVKHWHSAKEETHALILTSISPGKLDFVDGSNEKHHDFVVDFIDPNDPQSNYQHTWAWFQQHWTGRAYAFEAAERPTVVAVPATPLVVTTVRLPSNQDIKDGVLRPQDELDESYYRLPGNYDYYADFKKRFGPRKE
jgi:hypothetical protein